MLKVRSTPIGNFRDCMEMNLHDPQTIEAEAELRYLSSAKHNIVSAQQSKPIIQIVQDTLIAAYLMTHEEFPLTKAQFFDITMKGSKPDGSDLWDPQRVKDIKKILKTNGKKFLSGRGLISLCLPHDLYYTHQNNVSQKEPIVKIVNGVLIEGTLDKSILGPTFHSLVNILNKEYNADVATNFIDNMQFIGSAWLLVHGFSIGLGDCLITGKESVDSIKETLTQCYTKAKGIEETTYNPGIREIRIIGSLSQAKDIGMKIAKNSMRKDNNLITSVSSGAKGDFFNIAQITGLLGQQNLEGKRVTPLLNGGKRTLPHYPLNEKMELEREYESRGFIKNSFIHGLSPTEFFFHAMSGREGVCDTATGTANSGYLQRKIVKTCEDIQVQHDGTVRDATGKIYQYTYGGNGYNPSKCVRIGNENQPCDVKRIAERLNQAYMNGHEVLQDMYEDPEIEINEIKEDVVDVNKQKLINKIRQRYPESIIDKNWDMDQLVQRLEALQLEIEEDDSDIEEEETEDHEALLDKEETEEDEEDKDTDDEMMEEMLEEMIEEYDDCDDYGGDD